ncbi:MAG TPA: UbiX family flavin prenyltransferase [Polyangiaceae bacterium]|nr:UbiX family flavin prenyltransferase [Polyangiaceae bacterium]
MTAPGPRKIVVGVTGASGAPYARRLLALLADRAREHGDVAIGCVLSPTARTVWKLECGGAPEDFGITVHAPGDFGAPFASGSAGWHAMVVIPCSMSAAGRIAHGTGESLLTRAADVMLKERRTLIVVPRETPMSVIHLENLVLLARAGALVLPACPSFYGQPRTLADAVDTVVGRVLDHIGVEHDLVRRWGASAPAENAGAHRSSQEST